VKGRPRSASFPGSECRDDLRRIAAKAELLCRRVNGLLDTDLFFGDVNFQAGHAARLSRAVEDPARRTVRVRRAPNLTPHGFLNADERIRWPGAGPIAAERQQRPALLQAVPAIGWGLSCGSKFAPMSPQQKEGCMLTSTESFANRGRSCAATIVGVLQAEAAVARAVLFLHGLVGIQHHLHGVTAQRVRHDLVAALVQFQHQFFVFVRRIGERR